MSSGKALGTRVCFRSADLKQTAYFVPWFPNVILHLSQLYIYIIDIQLIHVKQEWFFLGGFCFCFFTSAVVFTAQSCTAWLIVSLDGNPTKSICRKTRKVGEKHKWFKSKREASWKCFISLKWVIICHLGTLLKISNQMSIKKKGQLRKNLFLCCSRLFFLYLSQRSREPVSLTDGLQAGVTALCFILALRWQ